MIYSWSFTGSEVKNISDIDMNIDFSSKLPQNVSAGSAVLISVHHRETLPGPAELYGRVQDYFADTDSSASTPTISSRGRSRCFIRMSR